MPRYKLIVAYDGTRFNGFQRQTTAVTSNLVRPGVTKRKRDNDNYYHDAVDPSQARPKSKRSKVTTVQECLEFAMATWSGVASTTDLALRFAGRTDKGVHTTGQVCVCTLPDVATWEMRKSINSRLPDDVSVENIEPCSDAFDPRAHCKLKQYSYTIKYRRLVQDTAAGTPLSICGAGPNGIRHALDPPCLWVVPWVLQDDVIQETCNQLRGSHNFQAFVHKEDRLERDHVMTLEKFSFCIVKETEEAAPVVTAIFTAQATGFRRSMVRNLVGFCVDVARGSLRTIPPPVAAAVSAVDWDDVWSGSEAAAGKIHAAPACGLCLDRVDYESNDKDPS